LKVNDENRRIRIRIH